jgi:hypothetical protein
MLRCTEIIFREKTVRREYIFDMSSKWCINIIKYIYNKNTKIIPGFVRICTSGVVYVQFTSINTATPPTHVRFVFRGDLKQVEF